MIGEETFDYFVNPVVTFETNEGDLVVEDDNEVQSDGAEDITQKFPAVIRKGNFVMVDSFTTEGKIRVKNAPGGTQDLLGIAFAKAAPRKGEGETIPSVPGTYDGSPGFPTVHREVPVELFGDFIGEVPVHTSGTAVTLAASIAPHSSEPHRWEGDASRNHTYALKPATLGTDTTTIALFGYRGNH
jgi:hypothetical protein